MNSKTRTFLWAVLVLASWATVPAAVVTASLTVEFTNRGEPLPDPSQGRFYIYEEGKRERYLSWGTAVRAARVPEGTYDIVIRYVNDAIVEEQVLESYELKGDVTLERAFEIWPAYLTIEITAGGTPIQVHSGGYDVHVAGTRGEPLASRRPGQRLTLPPGRYDIEVRHRDPRGLQSAWLTDYFVVAEHVETVDIGVAPARLQVSMTYRGVALLPGEGEWDIHRPGDPQPLTGGSSGERVELPAGIYDLRVAHHGFAGEPLELWVRDVTVTDGSEQIIELLDRAPSELSVVIRRAGKPLRDAWFTVYPAGQPLNPMLTQRSGDSFELPAGMYDIHCTYRRGSIWAERWVRNREVEGPTEVVVDLPLSTASLTIRSSRRIRKPIERSSVLILLDSSLEMDAPMGSGSRMELVQRTLLDTIGSLEHPAVDVGIRVWGIAPQMLNDCRDSTLLVPPAPLDKRQFDLAFAVVRPSGLAPIAHSLLEASEDLPISGRATVIVITGSTDGCSGDPCDAAARLLKRGRADRIHVIALDQPKHAEGELACIGTYHGVSSRLQLRNSLRSIFREARREDRGRVTAFLPGRNRWVASGELGQPIQLLEGRYDLLIRAGVRVFHWNNFQVRGDVVEHAGKRR